MKIQNNLTLNAVLLIAVLVIVAWFAGADHGRRHAPKVYEWHRLSDGGGKLLRTSEAGARHGSRSGGSVGGNSAGLGTSSGQASSAQGQQGQSGQGSRYSAADPYQPWPQAEMQQFAKPHWTPYTGI